MTIINFILNSLIVISLIGIGCCGIALVVIGITAIIKILKN